MSLHDSVTRLMAPSGTSRVSTRTCVQQSLCGIVIRRHVGYSCAWSRGWAGEGEGGKGGGVYIPAQTEPNGGYEWCCAWEGSGGKGAE